MLSKMRTTLMVGTVAVAAGTASSMGVDGLKLQSGPWVDKTESGRTIYGDRAKRHNDWIRADAARRVSLSTYSVSRSATKRHSATWAKGAATGLQNEPKSARKGLVKTVEVAPMPGADGSGSEDDPVSFPPSPPDSQSEQGEITPPPSARTRAAELAKDADQKKLAEENARAAQMSNLADDAKFMSRLEQLMTAFRGMKLNQIADANITNQWLDRSEQLEAMLENLRQNHNLWDALKLLENDEKRLNIKLHIKGMKMMHSLSAMLRILKSELSVYYMHPAFGASTIKNVAESSHFAFISFYAEVQKAKWANWFEMQQAAQRAAAQKPKKAKPESSARRSLFSGGRLGFRLR